jgi:Mg2+ and Co2+ transporter CorA
MAIPWMAALKAAETLLSSTTARRQAADAARQLQTVESRLAALETHDETTARLLVQLTEELQSLGRASERQARMTRRLTALGIVAVVLSLIALVTAFVR